MPISLENLRDNPAAEAAARVEVIGTAASSELAESLKRTLVGKRKDQPAENEKEEQKQ